MTYRTSSFEHEGHRLVYDEYGSGDSVVVYLHGLLLDSNLNRGIADALADRGNRVVLLDLLGHGRSDSPAPRPNTESTVMRSRSLACSITLGSSAPCLVGCHLAPTSASLLRSSTPNVCRAWCWRCPCWSGRCLQPRLPSCPCCWPPTMGGR